MFVSIKYEVILLNNNKLTGVFKGKVGQTFQELKLRLLQKEGIKNLNSFIHENSNKKTTSSSFTVREVNINKVTSKSKSSGISNRKPSFDSMFQQSSMDYEDESKQFIATEPEMPPVVRGMVHKSNSFLCCFSSILYLQLQINQLRIYANSLYKQVSQTISINEIERLKSYRKKQYFFIRMQFRDENFDFKFTNSNLCKEWMGYLMQAMAFNKYLNQRKIFSRADSFTKYLVSLNQAENTRIVTLQPQRQQLESIHEQLPQENQVMRQSKRFTKLSQFQICYKIGSGSFSLVYWAKRKQKIYALKQLSKDKLLMKNQMKYAITERKVLITCRQCKYIIPMYFAFQTFDSLYMAFKFVPTGDLGQYIKTHGPIPELQSLILLAELVFAVEFLHQKKIIYRDLKPENLLLDPQGHFYLVDFGLAKQLNNEQELAQSFLGTPLYLAPERFTGSGSINFKSDIYGVGCIFYEMLHGKSPFIGSNYNSLANKIKNTEPDISVSLPEDFKSFLKESLEKDPQKRINKMSKHKIFKTINWKEISQRSHKGIQMGEAPKFSGVQISYIIDEDYNQQNFPNQLINGWEFSYQQKSKHDF